jgi:hypothetical protein
MKKSPRGFVAGGDEIERVRMISDMDECTAENCLPLKACGSFDLSPRVIPKKLEAEIESPQFGLGGVWRPVSNQRQRLARNSTLNAALRSSPSYRQENEISPIATSPYSDSQSSTDESEISSTTSTIERSPSPPISPERDRLESDKIDCLNMPPPALGPLASFHRARPHPIPLLTSPSSVPHVPVRDEHASDSEASCRSTPPGDISRTTKGPSGTTCSKVDDTAAELVDVGDHSSKKRRRDKFTSSSASRLSFSDDLDLDGSESSGDAVPVSMSKATQKRFRQEERSRRHTLPPIQVAPASPAVYTVPAVLEPAAMASSGPGQVRVFDDDEDAARARPLARVSCDVCERQGRRPYMEDTFFILPDYISSGSHLFGVFDGHGGSRASVYSRDEMPGVLRRHLALQGIDRDFTDDERDAPPGAASEATRDAVSTAFAAAFLEIDRLFLDVARSEGLRDGTTALVALLRANRLHVGWVGDSRGVLCRQGRFVRVSEDHKPDRPEERRAVEARGGTVIFRSVDLVLNAPVWA